MLFFVIPIRQPAKRNPLNKWNGKYKRFLPCGRNDKNITFYNSKYLIPSIFFFLNREIPPDDKNAGDKSHRQRRNKKKKIFLDILIHANFI